MVFFIFLECVAIALAGCHAGLLLRFERVGQVGGMGMYTFCMAWVSTYAAAASLLYTFIFSVTLCPPLGVSIGFMRPGPAHGSASRLSPTCWGWTVLSIQYLLAAGFATGITLGQAHSEADSAGILFGTAVGMFCAAASIITVLFFGALEWTCMGTCLGMTRPGSRLSHTASAASSVTVVSRQELVCWELPVCRQEKSCTCALCRVLG